MLLKPVFSALTVYIPGGSEGKKYSPASLVVTVRAALVPVLTTVTVTSAAIAPLESRTSPPIEPNVWPKANWPVRRTHPKTNSRAGRERAIDGGKKLSHEAA